VLILAACAGTLPQSQNPLPSNPPVGSKSLYVVRRGWHIDICIAAADLREPLAVMTTWFPDVRYLVFGFGDRRYLVDHDRRFAGLLAALWPGDGVILITGLSVPPAQAFGAAQVIPISLGAAQFQAAQMYIWQSLAQRHGSLAPSAPGPYAGSLFFPARLRYSALHTCNTWAAEVLITAGSGIHSIGIVLAPQLWAQARRIKPAPESVAGRVRAVGTDDHGS
jgi:hypothetical protein